MFEHISFARGRVPESCIICRRKGQILGYAGYPGRKPIGAGVIIWNDKRDLINGQIYCRIVLTDLTYLDFGVVRNGRFAVDGRNGNLENTELILLHFMRVEIPVVYKHS